jgi:hypothetical protein
MLTAKPTDTVADLAARIREDRAKPPAPGQIVTPWMWTPEEAAEMMIEAAQQKARLDAWEGAAFKAQRARCIEAARALDDADEVEHSAAFEALRVEMDKLNALDPGPWHYVVAPGHPEPVRWEGVQSLRRTRAVKPPH